MLSFGSIPDIAGSVSVILCFLSLAVDGYAVIAYLISLFGNDYQTKAAKYSTLFASGIHIRNSMFCTLLLLFFISNTNTMTTARKSMKMIASVCRIYCIGAAVVLAMAIISSILTAIRSISVSSVHEANKKLWRSSLLSFSCCLIISYFMSP